MNIDTFLRILEKCLSSIRYYSEILQELLSILKQGGNKAAFIKILSIRLQSLAGLGVLATREKEFELIERGIYSMHVSSRGFNCRIMYAFLPSRTPVLLHAFFEKAGKKKTDYTGKVDLALSRLKIMKEEFENEQHRI